MKLSDAIREGAKLRPQCFSQTYFHEGCSCALGAALEAVGFSYGDMGRIRSTVLGDLFPILLSHRDEHGLYDCPIAGCPYKQSPFSVIAHLNDHHRWTREQIADWVEQIEVASEQMGS